MLYGFFHLLLLLGATLGVWAVRRRMLLVVGGLLLFPLPAAMFNYFAAPIPAVVATIPEAAAVRGDCADLPSPGGGAAENRDDAKPDCPSLGDTTRQEALLMVVVVNGLTVFMGFAAAMLGRRALAR